MKLALVLGFLCVAFAEPEGWQYGKFSLVNRVNMNNTKQYLLFPTKFLGFYQHHPAVYTHGLAHTYHQAPYVPLVYTHPQVQYVQQPLVYKLTTNTYKSINKKSIPYGCNVDYKVKYDIEKVEYFDEKCETKYK